MRHHMHFVLQVSIFITVGFKFLCGRATPFNSNWGDVHVKHSWSLVPDDWTNLGHPAADATIDLNIALKAQDENALIEALYEVSSPDHPKCVFRHHSSMHHAIPTHHCSVKDMANTCHESRSLSSLRHLQTYSSSSTPGSYTMVLTPPRS
jgi:hypothetical protein